MCFSESANIGDILQDILAKIHVKPRDTRPDSVLLELFDPNDFLMVLPNIPLIHRPIGMKQSNTIVYYYTVTNQKKR